MKGGEAHSGKKEKSSQEKEKVRGFLITSNREPSCVVVPGFFVGDSHRVLKRSSLGRLLKKLQLQDRRERETRNVLCRT
jgi:hypothetical protein